MKKIQTLLIAFDWLICKKEKILDKQKKEKRKEKKNFWESIIISYRPSSRPSNNNKKNEVCVFNKKFFSTKFFFFYFCYSIYYTHKHGCKFWNFECVIEFLFLYKLHVIQYFCCNKTNRACYFFFSSLNKKK